MKKVKDDDIIISCDKKYTCYEHLHANECLMAYRKECKLSNKYKQALKEIRKEAKNACKGCTSECDCIIDDEPCKYYGFYHIRELIDEVLK